jgi:hypothetical protein
MLLMVMVMVMVVMEIMVMEMEAESFAHRILDLGAPQMLLHVVHVC